LSDTHFIQNYLKLGDALSPLLLNFALEYAIAKVQENQVELKLNGHIICKSVYADDISLLGDNILTIKENKETLIDVNNKVDLEANTEETKYMCMLLSRH
jgi:hypothetical protein